MANGNSSSFVLLLLLLLFKTNFQSQLESNFCHLDLPKLVSNYSPVESQLVTGKEPPFRPLCITFSTQLFFIKICQSTALSTLITGSNNLDQLNEH